MSDVEREAEGLRAGEAVEVGAGAGAGAGIHEDGDSIHGRTAVWEVAREG